MQAKAKAERMKSDVLKEIKRIQQPTRLRVNYVIARALKQLVNKPKQIKHINPPQQAPTKHQLQVSLIPLDSTCCKNYALPEHRRCKGVTREEHGIVS